MPTALLASLVSAAAAHAYLAAQPQYCGGGVGSADYLTAAVDPADQGVVWVVANFTGAVFRFRLPAVTLAGE